MVRQFEAPRRGATRVILDTRLRRDAPLGDDGAGVPPVDAAFERAVEAAASIVTSLQRRRRPVECCTSAGTMLTRGPGDTGPTVLDRLATITAGEDDDLTAVLAGLRRRPPELVILVTAALDNLAVVALRACAQRSAVLVVCTGGAVAPAQLRIVDARVEPFPDAWRSVNTLTHASVRPSWTSAALSRRPAPSPR